MITGFYLIGDLMTHTENVAIQENSLKVLPLVLPRILEKLGEAKLVIRQNGKLSCRWDWDANLRQ